jgi:hypothetical protein
MVLIKQLNFQKMKKNIITRSLFILLAIGITGSCETDIEKAQENYDASMVIPKVMSVTGPNLALQTKSYNFTVGYSRAGSTWEWSAENATVQSVSADTKTATVLFNVLPASGHATVLVKETTVGGNVSPEKTIDVTVNPFCPLAQGLDDMVGSWSGDDAGYESVIETVKSGSLLKATGMGVGFIEDFWAEEVISEAQFTLTVNDDGTVVIARQIVFTTVYEGDEYEYEILGAGTWDNCGSTPILKIKYDIYYPGDVKGLAATYAQYLDNIPYLTADISLGEPTKGTITLNPPKLSPRK